MQTPNLTPIECDGALSDLILQAARQALPAHVDSLLTLPDVGRHNRLLLPLLVGLIDATQATAQAFADNAWDQGQPMPDDLMEDLRKQVQAISELLQSAAEVC